MSEGFISRGFRGRRKPSDQSGRIPPGQYLERGFPVLEDEPGFWESLGYNNHGDPWKEERYWGD
jgi:DMSO/TMAO reductase YedYZ molybdopterin-dependent catalytic subunit